MKTSTQHMQAIKILTPGGPHVLEYTQVRKPLAQKGEVLIKVAASGVNRPDILQRMGLYNPPPNASPILGLEVAGTICELGVGCRGFQIGDQVVALTNGGGYAQYVSVPIGQILPLPNNYTMVEGASLPETLFTVQQTLVERAGLTDGQTILVHGGGSGIGATAIQLAKLHNAQAITTISSDEKANYAKHMGASETINYLREDFVEVIDKLTEGKGVDIILDIVGGDYLDRHLLVIAQGGTIIQLGLLGGAKAEINLARLLTKHVTLFGSTLRSQPDKSKAKIAQNLLDNVWPALNSGRIKKPRIITFPLRQAEDAHRAMLSSDHYGKIVLVT